MLLQDLSLALGLPVECFEVDDVLPGSVIVQVGVYLSLVTSFLLSSPTFYLSREPGQRGQHTCVNKDLTHHANVSSRAAISLPSPVKYVLETFVCGSNPPSMKSMKTSPNVCFLVAIHARTAPMAISELSLMLECIHVPPATS